MRVSSLRRATRIERDVSVSEIYNIYIQFAKIN